jgi:hypothetical protein
MTNKTARYEVWQAGSDDSWFYWFDRQTGELETGQVVGEPPACAVIRCGQKTQGFFVSPAA